jgi:hypothetical protein
MMDCSNGGSFKETSGRIAIIWGIFFLASHDDLVHPRAVARIAMSPLS